MTTKPTRPMTAAANSAMISGEPQPQALPSTSARTSAVRPVDSAAMPGKSTVRATVSSRDSRVANSVTTTATTATGRLRKKIARQETYSVSAPPTTGPIASASAETPAQVPIALPRSSGGKALVMIERVAGIMNAAPMPWIARPPTSQAWSGARPMAALESGEDDDAEQEHAPPAEDVAQPAAGHQQHGEGERVGVDRPLEATRARRRGRPGSTAAPRSRPCCRA